MSLPPDYCSREWIYPPLPVPPKLRPPLGTGSCSAGLPGVKYQDPLVLLIHSGVRSHPPSDAGFDASGNTAVASRVSPVARLQERFKTLDGSRIPFLCLELSPGKERIVRLQGRVSQVPKRR